MNDLTLLKLLFPLALLAALFSFIGWIAHSYHATRREISEYQAEQRRSAPFEPKAPKCQGTADGRHKITGRLEQPGMAVQWVCLHCGVIKDNGGK